MFKMLNNKITLAIAGLLTLPCIPPVQAATVVPKWVSGYYPLYQRSLYPSTVIGFSSLTHLVVGRIWPNADGSVNISFDMDTTTGPKAAKELVQKAHAANKKAIVMVGGADTNWNGEWTGASNATNRAVFIKNLLQVASNLGFDGFDLDWEENIDFPQFLALAKELRAAAPTKTVTIPVMWVNPNWQQIDPFYKNIAPYIDQMNIMSYGMADNWEGWQSWHSSALKGAAQNYPSSVDSSVQAYLKAGIPAAKLGVGIGFYGSCWSSPITGPRQNLTGLSSHVVSSDNEMTYATIMNQYYTAQNYRYDTVAQAPYLSSIKPIGSKQCSFVSYENEVSVTAKANYIKQNNLGGAIIWTINQGYNIRSKTPNGLLEAVGKALR